MLACLSHVPEQYHGSKRDLRRWFHEESTWQGSDIDIFLYGMDERAAQQKLLRLADALADGIPWDTVCIRTNHTVTSESIEGASYSVSSLIYVCYSCIAVPL